ncbi:MAG: metallophosphoesterase [SAR324 cluster bacterium]|nr:metallophosphoesterase [SAR324 cluster bacterium]
MTSPEIAIIGDIHGQWTSFDTEYFNQSDYSVILLTGDLARWIDGTPTARALKSLNKPVFLIPGNHDGITLPQFLAEFKNIPSLCEFFGRKMEKRMMVLGEAMGPRAHAGGYRLHTLEGLSAKPGLITARPHSMGGNRMYFRPYLRQKFGVDSLQDSVDLLKKLIDQAPEQLIFLGHNGPHGLGSQPQDLWGCDFSTQYGDFGDKDLELAIAYARASGRQVLAVIAGHMHHALKRQTSERDWWIRQHNTLYLNPAKVPRIFKQEGRKWHHHLALALNPEVDAHQVWVCPDGSTRRFSANSIS